MEKLSQQQTEEENKNTLDSPIYAFYGSLRKEMGNHPGLRDSEFISKEILHGYKLYSLGAYPYIVASGDKSDTVIVELYNVKNPQIEAQVHWMELGAGYSRVVENIAGTDAYVYVWEEGGGHEQVKDGDWVKYKKARQ